LAGNLATLARPPISGITSVESLVHGHLGCDGGGL
jgi:hypothetical protein